MDKKGVHETGKRLGFTTWQAEKDYLQHLFLRELYAQTSVELVFKGGTCLQKAYGLHRFSRDLDFNGIEAGSGIKIKRIAERLLNFGLPNHMVKMEDTPFSLNFLIAFDSSVVKNSLTVQISKRERLGMPPKQVAITPLYVGIPPYLAVCMQEEEIAAEKIRAIYQRTFPRDVYDFWFLLQKGISPPEPLVNKKLKRISQHYDKEIVMDKIRSVSKSWHEMGELLPAYPPLESVVKDIDGNL